MPNVPPRTTHPNRYPQMPGALELRRIFVESAAAPAERIALLAKSLKAMLSQNPRAFPAALACVCQWLSPDAYREVLNGIEPSQHRTAS